MSEISVVIPVNDFKNLDSMLLSLFIQSFPDLEIILINNKADELTTELINNYAKFDKRVKVIILPERTNILRCCRIGSEYSRGKYITFLDSSKMMFYAQSALCRLLSKAKKNNSDIVYCATLVHELDTFKMLKLYQKGLQKELQKEVFEPKELSEEILFQLNLSIFGKLYKKEFFNSFPSIDYDETYFLNLFFNAKTISYDDVCLLLLKIKKPELVKADVIFEQNANLHLLQNLNLLEKYKDACIKHKLWKYCIDLSYAPDSLKSSLTADIKEDLKNTDLSKYSVIGEMI